MRRCLVALLLAALGCKKAAPKPAEPPADNAATRYVSGLQDDVKRAKSAQEKANAAVRQTSQEVGEASEEPPGQ